MNDKALDLFIKNYENKGLCEKLPGFVKFFTKKDKQRDKEKKIFYYPWAVIERIFRMQGGTIEILDWVKPIESSTASLGVDDETGEQKLIETLEKALFIHIKATWQGETLDEYYPIFDTSLNVIRTPNAMDLNKARQRGTVRLVARLSGIGLDIFEQQDSQFEDDGESPENSGVRIDQHKDEKPEDTKKPEKKETISKKDKDKKKQETALSDLVKAEKESKEELPKEKIEKAETIADAPQASADMKSILAGDIVDTKVEAAKEIKKEKEEFVSEEFDQDSEEYASLLMEVRTLIKTNKKQSEARDFRNDKGKELISELTYSELEELKAKIG